MSEKTNQELLDMIDHPSVDVVIEMRIKQNHQNIYDFMFNSMHKEDPARFAPDTPKKLSAASEVMMCIAQTVHCAFPKINDFRRGFKERFLESLQYVKDKDYKIAFYNKDGNIDKLTDAIIKDMNIETKPETE